VISGKARMLRSWFALTLYGVGSSACRAPSELQKQKSPSEPEQHRPPASFIWHELVASDPGTEAVFYADVVGWKTKQDDASHFTLLKGRGDAVSGISRLTPALKKRGLAPRWVGRVAVEDVDATVAKTRLHGGQVALEPIDLPDFRFAILVDPAGTTFQVADSKERGPVGKEEGGGAFSWDELATPDGLSMTTFYGSVLRWEVLSVTPVAGEVKYFTLGREGARVAGVFVDPSLRETDWIAYVDVSDLDQALARATRDGATVIGGPEAVPTGRMARIRDPEGAIFGLREPSKTSPPAKNPASD
jgi:predicted enzyme related to lactoylglutathione lyase